MLAAPLLLGCDLERLDDFTVSLLTNDEVLAIDQDPLGQQAACVSEQAGKVTIRNPTKEDDKGTTHARAQVWSRPLEDGSVAVGLFNLGDETLSVTANFADVKVTGKQIVRDLWRQKDLGEFEGKFETTVRPHGAVLVRLRAAK